MGRNSHSGRTLIRGGWAGASTVYVHSSLRFLRYDCNTCLLLAYIIRQSDSRAGARPMHQRNAARGSMRSGIRK
jgi:hypothetical protein